MDFKIEKWLINHKVGRLGQEIIAKLVILMLKC